MGDLKDFPYPLNTPLEQEEEVERVLPVIDPVTKRVTAEVVKEKIRTTTTYHHSTPEQLSCGKGKHSYRLKDPAKYVASCPNCMRNRIINPITTTIRQGHLILRSTGEIQE